MRTIKSQEKSKGRSFLTLWNTPPKSHSHKKREGLEEKFFDSEYLLIQYQEINESQGWFVLRGLCWKYPSI